MSSPRPVMDMNLELPTSSNSASSDPSCDLIEMIPPSFAKDRRSPGASVIASPRPFAMVRMLPVLFLMLHILVVTAGDVT